MMARGLGASLLIIFFLCVSMGSPRHSDEKWVEIHSDEKTHADSWAEVEAHVIPSELAEVVSADSTPGTCETWQGGAGTAMTKTKAAEQCAGTQQCITTKLDDMTTSGCDTQNICTGMGTGSFSIADGTCGIIPGLGQHAYCSKSTPPGGLIPSSVECKAITISPPPSPPTASPSSPTTPATTPTMEPSSGGGGSGDASCETWIQAGVGGDMSMLEIRAPCTTGNKKQCFTSEPTSECKDNCFKSSNCDFNNMCQGLNRGYWSLADGECGISNGQKIYCSSSTPKGGLIPDSVVCKNITVNQNVGPNSRREDDLESGASQLSWQGVGMATTIFVVMMNLQL